MLTNKTRVLLILPQDLLDRARVLAGKSTTAFKLPVSLQIVLRALVEEGLRRDHEYVALLANIEGQARAVRRLRTVARQPRPVEEKHEHPTSAVGHRASGRERTSTPSEGAVGTRASGRGTFAPRASAPRPAEIES
jgi:hypothetical protein